MNTYIPQSDELVIYTKANLSSRDISRSIHIVQYDTLHTIGVVLFKNNNQYIPPQLANVSIRFSNNRLNSVYKPVLGYDPDKPYIIYFKLDSDMTECHGPAVAVLEIKMTSNDSERTEMILNTKHIKFMIDRNPIQQ